MAQMEETYPGWRKEYDEHFAKNPIQEHGVDNPEDYWNKEWDCDNGDAASKQRGWQEAAECEVGTSRASFAPSERPYFVPSKQLWKSFLYRTFCRLLA